MANKITLSEAKARKFKRHDRHYEWLMAQETETIVTYPEEEIMVDYSDIRLVNNMVYVHGTSNITNTPLFMAVE